MSPATGDKPRSFSRPVELLLYGLAPVATLATAPILAHGLGPVGRGQYGVATAVGGFALALGAWGQAEVFLNRARLGNAHFPHHTRISWVGGIGAAVVAAAILIALGIPPLTSLLTVIWIPILSQIGLWRALSISRNELKPPALDSALGPLLRVIFFAALFFTSFLTVNTAMTAFQAALALGAILTVGIALRRSRGQHGRAQANNRELLFGGGAIIAFNILHAVTLRADVIVLQLVSTPEQVGLYAAPASLTTAALALSAAYRPRVQAAAFGPSPLRGIAREAVQVLVLGILGAIVLWFSAPIVVPILFGNAFIDAEPLMRLLSIAIVPLLMVDIIFGALVVLGRRRELILVAAVAAAGIVLSLCLLCPPLGASGAAIACIVSYTFAAIFGCAVLVRVIRRNATAAMSPEVT